ncbi:hypothetical protein GC194_11090 [bacterium]|nr:hypothetical protein [bacterium]
MQFYNSGKAVVIISDCADFDPAALSVTNRDVDRVHRDYVDELRDAIKTFHNHVVVYNSPLQFMKNIEKHANDLVLPYWYGINSRNRHALVPAICEAANIAYIGGDTYTKTVTNDKQLCKWHIEKAGLQAPRSTLLYAPNEHQAYAHFDYPLVVKPLFEGTSLGISQDNLVENQADAQRLVQWVFDEFGGPVMVEEFARGREVSICLIGHHQKISAWATAERYKVNQENYLHDKLYAFADKNSEEGVFALRSMNLMVPQKVLDASFRLFAMLDKVEYMRVDGRLNGDSFKVIELTPESHLGHDAEFCGTFISNGRSYHEVIKMVVDNSLERAGLL